MLSIFAIVYLAFIATLIGYSLWSKLLARYPASQVAPFSLLVPIVGLASAALLLGEALTPMQIAGCRARDGRGLAVNVFGGWHCVAARIRADIRLQAGIKSSGSSPAAGSPRNSA